MSRRLVHLAIALVALHAQRSLAGQATTLSLTKTAVGSEAASPPAPTGALIPGTAVTFTNTSANTGDNPSFNHSITDPLPAQVVLLSAITTPGASVTAPALNTNGTVTATWDAAGGTTDGLTFPGTSRVVAIGARICPEAGCTLMSNTATVSTDRAMSVSAATDTPLFPQADLSITKSASVEHAVVGSAFTYTLDVANAGPSNSASTQVVDTLPPGVVATNVTTTIPGASCNIASGGGTVTCNFALGASNQCSTPIATNGQISIDVSVTGAITGGLNTNHATIDITGTCGSDPAPENNTATVDVSIGAAAAPALSSITLVIAIVLLMMCGSVALRRRAQ